MFSPKNVFSKNVFSKNVFSKNVFSKPERPLLSNKKCFLRSIFPFSPTQPKRNFLLIGDSHQSPPVLKNVLLKFLLVLDANSIKWKWPEPWFHNLFRIFFLFPFPSDCFRLFLLKFFDQRHTLGFCPILLAFKMNCSYSYSVHGRKPSGKASPFEL